MKPMELMKRCHPTSTLSQGLALMESMEFSVYGFYGFYGFYGVYGFINSGCPGTLHTTMDGQYKNHFIQKKKQNKRKIMQCTSKMTNSNYARDAKCNRTPDPSKNLQGSNA